MRYWFTFLFQITILAIQGFEFCLREFCLNLFRMSDSFFQVQLYSQLFHITCKLLINRRRPFLAHLGWLYDFSCIMSWIVEYLKDSQVNECLALKFRRKYKHIVEFAHIQSQPAHRNGKSDHFQIFPLVLVHFLINLLRGT